MRIIVTGGAGFIGSHLCKHLLSQGHTVACLDNLSTGRLKNISDLLSAYPSTFSLHRVDINNSMRLQHLFHNFGNSNGGDGYIDTVYHLAAVVGVKRTLENPYSVLCTNIQGTVNVLDAACKARVRRFVNISSSEVYGDPVQVPESESSPKNADLPYAVSKLVGEKYAEVYAQTRGLSTISLRLFNVYGPRQGDSPYGFVVGIFVDQVLSGQSPTIFGDGFQTRDFTYIDDCVAMIALAADCSLSPGEPLNIGAGAPVTILDLAERILTLCGKPNQQPEFQPERPFDIRHRFADVSRMRQVLVYKPKVDLTQGLSRTIAYYRLYKESKPASKNKKLLTPLDNQTNPMV